MCGKKKWILALCFLLCLAFPAFRTDAASKYPKKIKLNCKSVTAMPGSTVTLKAKLSPSKVKNKKVTWSTSNASVATVSSSGVLKIVGYGTAKVTARTANGKKAVCKVYGVCYTKKNGKITVRTQAGTRTYKAYSQLVNNQAYYPSYGCVTTAVSIAASGFGKYYSPVAIHTGKASKVYSEKYAVARLKGSTSLSNRAALSVRTASQILTDIGISNQAVYTFTTASAVSQIRSHLKAGKPVIAKVNNKKVNGVRIANSHHAIVLIAVDDNDYVTFIDPVGAKINYAHASGKTCRLKLTELVKYHMDSATGNYNTPYTTSLKAAGGYILVG